MPKAKDKSTKRKSIDTTERKEHPKLEIIPKSIQLAEKQKRINVSQNRIYEIMEPLHPSPMDLQEDSDSLYDEILLNEVSQIATTSTKSNDFAEKLKKSDNVATYRNRRVYSNKKLNCNTTATSRTSHRDETSPPLVFTSKDTKTIDISHYRISESYMRQDQVSKSITLREDEDNAYMQVQLKSLESPKTLHNKELSSPIAESTNTNNFAEKPKEADNVVTYSNRRVDRIKTFNCNTSAILPTTHKYQVYSGTAGTSKDKNLSFQKDVIETITLDDNEDNASVQTALSEPDDEPYSAGRKNDKIPLIDLTCSDQSNDWDIIDIYNVTDKDNEPLNITGSKGCHRVYETKKNTLCKEKQNAATSININSVEKLTETDKVETHSNDSNDCNQTSNHNISAISPISQRSQTFSPLASTSKGNVTFIRTDIRFNESSPIEYQNHNCDWSKPAVHELFDGVIKTYGTYGSQNI